MPVPVRTAVIRSTLIKFVVDGLLILNSVTNLKSSHKSQVLHTTSYTNEVLQQYFLYRNLNQKPWVEGHASFADLIKANRYLMFQFGNQDSEENDRARFFPPDVFREFERMIKTLVRDDKIFISDRKLVKLYKLFRVRSWLLSGGTVTRDDLRLLMYLGETPEEMAMLREKVPTLLGGV